MSRVSDLEKKVDALERNVGMLAKEAGIDDCLKIAEYSSIVHYEESYKEGTKSNISLVINKTQIYKYDGTAIYDLHISSSLAYIWKTHMFVGGGVIRSMTVSDIKKFFYENPEFEEPGYLNIVQDINHMSDIYLIP